MRKERGMKEVEVNQLSDEIGALRDAEGDRMAKDDLRRLLLVVDRGVKEGVIKVGGEGREKGRRREGGRGGWGGEKGGRRGELWIKELRRE